VTHGGVSDADAFLIDAAVRFDPRKAQGLDGSLPERSRPAGPVAAFAIALGGVIFGLYS